MSRLMLAGFRRQFTTARPLFMDYQSRVFVGGLPWSIRATQLKETFSKFGNVTDVNIVTDPVSGRSRGFGFVQYDEVQHAEAAVHEGNGMDLEGRSISVQPCNVPRNRDAPTS
ncbi:hypothetical protein L249_5208 [Ophiocordyceps polyrhachis-furcata BCC 54312]|uniref:RRM domain-containing protein n=1 Tax=Ophiocordyceps polyrhachis-furcata BCC 54312 TaxID=1330021 RepID=A0A367L8X7_9HYPO|nr:hypothetical protein L249_5208 [Ophiocordyceps polyrhachis-furcata BCC 54312]